MKALSTHPLDQSSTERSIEGFKGCLAMCSCTPRLSFRCGECEREVKRVEAREPHSSLVISITA
jgi:hypothetical protein